MRIGFICGLVVLVMVAWLLYTLGGDASSGLTESCLAFGGTDVTCGR